MVSFLLGDRIYLVGMWRDEMRCSVRGIRLMAYELWKAGVYVR